MSIPTFSDALGRDMTAATEQASKDAPRLLDAEAFEELWRLTDSPSAMKDFLRERGLILPEPVDPLLVEAREMAEKRGITGASNLVSIRADHYRADLLAALRRGMELARGVTLDCGGEGA